MISIMTKFWEQHTFICIFLNKPIVSNAFQYMDGVVKEKKRGWDFITGCGYTMESFVGLQKEDIVFYL